VNQIVDLLEPDLDVFPLDSKGGIEVSGSLEDRSGLRRRTGEKPYPDPRQSCETN